MQSYDIAVKHLIESGWIKETSGVLTKGGFELVFDTSRYVELYEKGVPNRLAEGPVRSLDDMIAFLDANDLN